MGLERRVGFVMREIKKQKHKIEKKALENEWIWKGHRCEEKLGTHFG